MQVERATSADLPAIEVLLAANGLPLDGVAAAFETGVVARDAGVVVGAAALELFDGAALLRSVVVDDGYRGAGIGRRLVAHAERVARACGADEAYLLTETAADYFRASGTSRSTRGSTRGGPALGRVHDGLRDDRHRDDAPAPVTLRSLERSLATTVCLRRQRDWWVDRSVIATASLWMKLAT